MQMDQDVHTFELGGRYHDISIYLAGVDDDAVVLLELLLRLFDVVGVDAARGVVDQDRAEAEVLRVVRRRHWET